MILCLFEFSGVFATLYHRLGYGVQPIDLLHEVPTDILSWDYTLVKNVDGIIAHPPCTEFAASGARWWESKARNRPHLLSNALRLIHRTLEIINYHNPRFWFIENPIGRLPKYVNLGKPRLLFNPWEYAGWREPPWADVYTKRTCLWGKFQLPEKRPVNPGSVKSKMHNMSSSWKIERSITPIGFARAFVTANP